MLFPLSTERLLLRPAVATDAPALLELNRHAEVARYVHSEPWQTLAQAETWIGQQQTEQYAVHGFGRYVVQLHSTGEVIGWCGLKWRPEFKHVDLGYRIHPAHWGNGYATEAGEVTLLHGHHNLGYERLVGWAQTANPASVRVLQKLGGQHKHTWEHFLGFELTEYEFTRTGSAAVAPVLFSSARLDFREIMPDDAGVNYALNTDPEVVRYTGNPAFASVNACREFYTAYRENYTTYGYARWMATLRDSDDCIGWCGLKFLPERNGVDLGYRLFRRYWGKGLASEAAVATLAYGFSTLNMQEIFGYAYTANAASIRILQKCGMTFLHTETDEGGEMQRYGIRATP